MKEAALPAAGYRPPRTHIITEGQHTVRVYPEAAPGFKDFNFHNLKLSAELKLVFATGFAAATGPAGTRRTIFSAEALFAGITAFTNLMASSPNPPTKVSGLRASHLHELILKHNRTSASTIMSLRVILRANPDVPKSFRNALFTPIRPLPPSTPASSYSEAEFRAIQRAARKQVRAAAVRIRKGEAELSAWSEDHNEVTTAEERRRGQVLRHIATYGDIPRHSTGWAAGLRKVQSDWDLFYSLFPTVSEVTALVVLLQCLTGQNLSTIRNLTANYSRADGDDGDETRVLITRASKPRRGPFKADMDLSFTDTPNQQQESHRGRERDDFASAFGVYKIAERLCRRGREFAQSEVLLLSHKVPRVDPRATGLEFRPTVDNCLTTWSEWRDANGNAQRVDGRRLRRTFIELHQRPVAHSADTLVNTYLSRDAGSLAKNQAVVQRVLEGEVERIRSTNLSLLLTEGDVKLARTDPELIAKRFGVSSETLVDVLDGRLDTVATACVDNQKGPFTEPETACTASFLLCLGCPCARSEPRHIPVQALLRMRIEARKDELMPEQWDRKYGTALERLDDVLAQQRADVNLDAAKATTEDAILVEALLDGRLDLR